MARVTSSRDRSKGRASRPVTTSRGRANRQSASNARVSSSTNRPSGGNARVTVGRDRRPPSAAGTRDNIRPTSPSTTGRSLPPQGGTNGNSPRAQLEAGWARDRGARAQVGRFARTMEILGRGAARAAGVDRYSQAERRLNQSARGTRGEGVRVVGPEGANPKGQPRLPAGREPAALPPGRQGGALAQRPSGGAMANRPSSNSSALATRPNSSSALTTRGSSGLVDGRLVGVNVAEIQRRPRLEGQRALPSGQQALPPGRQGGALATRPGGGSLANRPSSGGGGGGRQLPGSSVRGRLPGGTGGADRVTGSGVRTGRPGPNRPALPPGRQGGAFAGRPSPGGGGSGGSRPAMPPGRQSQVGGRIGASTIRGGAVEGLLAGFLSPAVQDLGRKAGQWVGRNVLLPMVDRYEDKTPGTQSARERRRQIVREGGRQGPPVPERIRRGRTQQQAPSSRPSAGSSPASRYQGGNDGGGSSYQAPSQGSSAPSRPQRPQNRPSGASSAPSATTTPARSQRPAAAAPSSQSGGSSWSEKFNPGRGTSYTNNPLLRNDPYLMGKMKEREAKLPTGPVSDSEQYGQSLRIRKLKQDEEARKKKK